MFGDIGTSPLYALRECFSGIHAIPVTQANVLGVLSLIFWSLIFIVSIKYLLFVMRADNHGEGGILALVALVRGRSGPAAHSALIATGLFGAALLYGESMITPAISVLSAVEGVGLATHAFEPYTVAITVSILILLFTFQYRGTGRVGAVFGPIMVVWFITIGLMGVPHIRSNAVVLTALNPAHAVEFFLAHGLRSFITLGAVVLAVTGVEALYVDMGHFGRTPIRIAWFALVLPALLLNYLGQGALMLTDPAAAASPFYHLAPAWFLYPLIVLATVAAVIASQAVISGAFSLTQQAVQLGYSPRFDIQHTSAHEKGQVYIPLVNWMLMAAAVGLVVGFKSSTNLAAAYGMSVTGAMCVTTVLAYSVARSLWRWSRWRAGAVAAAFMMVDLAFLASNAVKIEHGGWFPLVMAALIYLVMSTWHTGRRFVAGHLDAGEMPLAAFFAQLDANPPVRVPGTAVFMTARPQGTPPILVHHLKHNQVLHAQVVLLSVSVQDIPTVDPAVQIEVQTIGHGFQRVIARYGFMEEPDVLSALASARQLGLSWSEEDTTFYLAHLTLFANDRIGMSIWRDRLFILLSRNARRATSFFHVPPDRVVEIGIQLEV